MKNLKNNFTTPEQSKRLLELGVPADSADCYYSQTCSTIVIVDEQIYKKKFYEVVPPIWSVGRLMEICKICEPKKDYEQLFEELQYSKNYCVVIISHIIANLPIIDFSKLED